MKSTQTHKISKNEEQYGVDNWVLLFFLCYLISFVIDNYLSYGIQQTPWEITTNFIHFIRVQWPVYAILFICYWVQIFLCYFIEKLLSINRLSEYTGLGMHLINSFLLLHLSAILFNFYNFNRIAGIALSIHLVVTTLKLLSYTLVNQRYRRKYFIEKSEKQPVEKEYDETKLEYPTNISLRNVINYMIINAECVYSNKKTTRKEISLKKLLSETFKAIFILYIIAFIAYQYLLPEVDRTVFYIKNKQFLSLIVAACKIALPANIVWILYFYVYGMKYMFNLNNMMWGSGEILIAKDWWNATTTTVFWNKWNYQVHIWFKEIIFIPGLKAGLRRRTCSFIVAFISGILHEFMLCIPCRTAYGVAFFGMMSQIVLAEITTSIFRNCGSKIGNLMMWFTLVFGETVCSIYIYYCYATDNYLQKN